MDDNILLALIVLFAVGLFFTRREKGNMMFVFSLIMLMFATSLWALRQKQDVIDACKRIRAEEITRR